MEDDVSLKGYFWRRTAWLEFNRVLQTSLQHFSEKTMRAPGILLTSCIDSGDDPIVLRPGL